MVIFAAAGAPADKVGRRCNVKRQLPTRVGRHRTEQQKHAPRPRGRSRAADSVTDEAMPRQVGGRVRDPTLDRYRVDGLGLYIDIGIAFDTIPINKKKLSYPARLRSLIRAWKLSFSICTKSTGVPGDGRQNTFEIYQNFLHVCQLWIRYPALQ